MRQTIFALLSGTTQKLMALLWSCKMKTANWKGLKKQEANSELNTTSCWMYDEIVWTRRTNVCPASWRYKKLYHGIKAIALEQEVITDLCFQPPVLKAKELFLKCNIMSWFVHHSACDCQQSPQKWWTQSTDILCVSHLSWYEHYNKGKSSIHLYQKRLQVTTLVQK